MTTNKPNIQIVFGFVFLFAKFAIIRIIRQYETASTTGRFRC